MTGPLRVYLDDTPGETRGIIADDHGWRQVLIDFEDDDPQQKLGARSVGRVARVEPNLKGVFVDLGDAQAQAFLPISGGQRLHEGEKVEVEVVSERRETKGVTLGLIGKGQGEPRLLAAGPAVRDWLARLAPEVTPIEGVQAIEAGWSALREAREPPETPQGLAIWIERTRAMVAVDFDHQPATGRRATPRDRLEANQRGLWATARALRLRGLAGLVAIDLIGAGQDGSALLQTAKAAFGADPDIGFGPVNRFGVMMLSLPWRFSPVEERLFGFPAGGVYRAGPAAVEATRRLRHALLSDPASPSMTLRCAPGMATLAAPLVARLGPRAHMRADATMSGDAFEIDTD